MKKYLQFHRLVALLVVAVPLAIAGCGGGSATKTDEELAAEKLAADRMACTDAGGRFESDGSCTSAAELVAEARAEAAEMACTDAGGRYESDGTCTSAADVEAERVAAEEAEAERKRQAETAAALSEAQMALSTAKAAVDMSADDAAQIEQQNAVVTAAQAVIDAARAASDVEALDAATADMMAARMAIADANARIAEAEKMAARQALVDAAMCTAATTECVAAHDALIAALQADVDALADDDDATNAQQDAAQAALEAAQMARRDVAMRVAEIDRSTATGSAVGAAVDAANALEDARSADDIASAEALLATAKGMLTDADDYASQIEMAEMAIARAKERNAVDAAVMAAETAATGLATESGEAAVTSAQGAVDAAKMEIEGAEHLTDAEKATQTAKVTAAQNSVTVAKNANDEAAALAKAEADRKAEEEAAAKAKADTAAGKALKGKLGPLTSLTSAGLTSSGLTTVTADPDGAGPRTAAAVATLSAGDSAGSSGGWTGTHYAHKSSGTGVSNSAIVYTNRGGPTVKPFATSATQIDGAALGTDVASPGGYSATDRTLNLGANPAATTDIKSDMFPTVGTTEYPNSEAEPVSIRGTYQGAPGVYTCSAATCTAAAAPSGAIDLGGQWHFVHDLGAMTSKADADYLYFGWWLVKDKDGAPTHASAFIGTAGTAPTALTGVTDIIGSATYSGGAAGKFAINDPINGGDAGHFTADATLTAKFSGTGEGISGTLDNFMANDKSVPWSVALNNSGTTGIAGIPSNNIGVDGAIAAIADNTDTPNVNEARSTVWSIDGHAASASGTWSGQMYDETQGAADDGINVPTGVTGVFESHFGSTHSMVGAFGATKE